MRKSHALIALVAILVTAPVFADSGGEGNNTNCNGQGNPSSPCVPGTPGTPGGNGGNGGAGGNATAGAVGVGVGVGVGIASAESNANATSTALANATNRTDVDVRNTNLNTNIQGQQQGQSQNQAAFATGGNATAVGGVAVVESGAVTNNNTATVGDVTATGGQGGSATATGGSGGNAVSAAVVESGAVQVAEGAVQSNLTYTYKEVRQAPAIGQGSFAISGCSVAGNAGASSPGGAGFLGFGFTPQQCYDFMLAQAYQSLGEKKAACDILRESKAGKRQAKRGITLPGCEPEVVTTVVPVPVPVDLSPYATKEELNRAFKASQSK